MWVTPRVPGWGGPEACAPQSEPAAAAKGARPALRSPASTSRPPPPARWIGSWRSGAVRASAIRPGAPAPSGAPPGSRQASCGAGDGDPVIGGVLGKPELADAEGEHRGERPIEVKSPLVDLPEMDEKLHLEAARFPHELLCGGKEFGGA